MVRGISGKVALGFCWSLSVFGGEMWVVSAVGRRGRVAEGLGEIGGRILNGSRGVSGSGSPPKEEAEGLGFLVDF